MTQKYVKNMALAEDDIVLFFMGWIYEFAGMKELARALGENQG